MSEAYGNTIERRQEFRCTCGDKLSFGCMQWDNEKKLNKVICVKCGQPTELKRLEDYGKFKEMQREYNGK